MPKRPAIPKNVEKEVLTKSRRRCCLCFHLDRADGVRKGQIAHLDHNPFNNKLDNLAWLCIPHHDEYDTTPSQSKGFTINEVKHYRDEMYQVLGPVRAATRARKHPAASQPATTNPVMPGTYSTYRLMLHDPAIALGRACLVETLRRCGWQVAYAEALSAEARALVDEDLQRVLPGFLKDSTTALDFGWAGFEIVWEVRDGLYHVSRLKWLDPEVTGILTDSHGSLSGLRQGEADLGEAKSLCVTVRGVTTSPANFYGYSQLEHVRELWSRLGRSSDFRQPIYDAYVGTTSSPHWFPSTIQPILDGLEAAVNELLKWIVSINFGRAFEKWARISFKPPLEGMTGAPRP